MKKIYFGAVFTLMSLFASAQDYDHWSIDIGGGIHQIGSTICLLYTSPSPRD